MSDITRLLVEAMLDKILASCRLYPLVQPSACIEDLNAVGTLAAAAIAIREAHREDLIDHGTAIWLCDDTPAGKIKYSQIGSSCLCIVYQSFQL